MTPADIQTAPVTAATALRFDSLITHVRPGLTSSRRTEIAAALARRFGARLIGLGAELVEPVPMGSPYAGELIGEVYAQLMREAQADLKSAQAAFARDAAEAPEVEWRAFEAQPTTALLATARAADLIVVGAEPEESSAYRSADTVEVMLRSGRPVLVAPVNAPHLKAEKILVAWKDTREARRAVHDALPFLAAAQDVAVLAVCREAEVDDAHAGADDLVHALRRRGAPARSLVVTAPDASVGHELNAEAAAIGADLIVAGGYGHSRAREWLLGGATQDLLNTPQRYLLLSH